MSYTVIGIVKAIIPMMGVFIIVLGGLSVQIQANSSVLVQDPKASMTWIITPDGLGAKLLFTGMLWMLSLGWCWKWRVTPLRVINTTSSAMLWGKGTTSMPLVVVYLCAWPDIKN